MTIYFTTIIGEWHINVPADEVLAKCEALTKLGLDFHVAMD